MAAPPPHRALKTALMVLAALLTLPILLMMMIASITADRR